MKTLTLAFVALACIMFTTVNSNAQKTDSAAWVPESANSIVIVNAKQILDSELGKEKKWKTERSSAFRSGAAFFPPNTERILLATQMDFQVMEPIWSVGVFEIKKGKMDIVDVSKRTNGNLDSIAGMESLVLPTDAILVQVDDKTIVSMAPANRQMTSRWINSKKGGITKISPYLTEAVKFSDDNADMIVAFDLGGVLGEDEIKERLKGNSDIDQSKLDQYAKTLASIEGITLGVTVRKKITGSIKIDFKSNPMGMSDVGKQILISALKKNGVMIDDFNSWDVRMDMNQLLLSGPLSESGFRQIGSLVRQPIHNDFASDEDSSSSVDEATRSKQYFGDVDHILTELRGRTTKKLSSYAKWFDRYAREIDGLSVLGVDESLLEYGQYTSNSFRDIAIGLRGNDMSREKNRANATKNSDPRYGGGYGRYGRYGGYGGYGYGNGMYMSRDRNVASNLGQMAGENQAKELFAEVEAATAKIRRELSKKYNLDF